MIETIQVGHLLRETAASPYRNLVTRPTGAAVRNRIEDTLARSDCLTALLDFSDIELLDFSCAEEIVAKLLLAQATGRPRFLLLRGLRDDQHDAIEQVLTHHRLAVAALVADGEPILVGLGDARCARGLRLRLPAGAGLRRRRRRGARLARAARQRRARCPDLAPAGPSRGRSAVPAAGRMSPRRIGLSTLAIHGVPRRRPDWTPVAPLHRPEQHLHQSRRLRGGSPLRPLRKYPVPGRPGQEIRAAGRRRVGHLPRERHGCHRAGPSRRAAPGRSPRQQQLDLRGHAPALRRGADAAGDDGHLRGSVPAPALAQVGQEEHPRHLRGDARPIR